MSATGYNRTPACPDAGVGAGPPRSRLASWMVAQITALPNHVYQVNATGTAVTVTVYASNGTTVLTSGSSARTFTSAAADTYYVKVVARSSSNTGSYTIAVQD